MTHEAAYFLETHTGQKSLQAIMDVREAGLTLWGESTGLCPECAKTPASLSAG